MLHIKTFTFNPYQENTYLLYNDEKDCIVIDPGMYETEEQNALKKFISENKLNPARLLNTHCHIDHVLGNKYIYDNYALMAEFHEGEIEVLMEVQNYASQMGFRYEPAPIGEENLSEGDLIKIGTDELKVLFVPGHSPAHICFYNESQNFLIGGDVLFKSSIGRTDLPGGNHYLLINNIRNTLYTLPDNTVVYPGHGGQTTIGDEKKTNPYVRIS